MRTLSLVLMLASSSLALRAEEKIDVSKAVDQAKLVAKAVLEGDYAKVADSTHPKVVEIMGGREKMIETTKTIMKSLKDQGISINSHVVGKAETPVIDGKSAYLVIPTTMVLKTEGMKVTVESYLLGMSTDGGKTWLFVDGSGMDNPMVKDKVFPKLPDGLKLPAKKDPTITKE